MTNEEYHADVTRISKSGLDLINRSPAHYYAEYLDPYRKARASKKHFVVGGITHMAILEPQYLERNYFILDDREIIASIGGASPRATTKYKEWKKEKLLEAKSREEVSIDDWEKVLRMRDAVHTHPAASLLLTEGVAETTVKFQCPETGAPCKARPDWLDKRNNLVVDLKTTDDASPDGFGRSAFNYRYHVQASFYFDGLYQSEIMQPNGFVFIAVEKSPPYAVGVYYVDNPTMNLGRQIYLQDLEVYQRCRQTGDWHGYPTEISALRVPGWALKKS